MASTSKAEAIWQRTTRSAVTVSAPVMSAASAQVELVLRIRTSGSAPGHLNDFTSTNAAPANRYLRIPAEFTSPRQKGAMRGPVAWSNETCAVNGDDLAGRDSGSHRGELRIHVVRERSNR